jgi:hypothetical protein
LTAEAIAKALGARRAGGGWTAHDDRIDETDDNKELVRCHAGCDQERVIAALRGRGLWAEDSQCSLLRMARQSALSRDAHGKTASGPEKPSLTLRFTRYYRRFGV